MKRSEYEAKLKKYEEEVEELKKCIKELKEVEIEEDGIWVPEIDEEYWFIYNYADLDYEIWLDYSFDKDRLAIGNVFKTKEEAEFEVERLKVLAELKQFSRKFKYGLANYYIDYDYINDIITYMLCYTDFIPTICFESKDVLKKAIEEVGEDRIKKYLFCIEEF